ncbi:hypothetical protein LTR85_001473 [Meristemomyces frigidus]|nr:hypothetical protein LTR85_001473 [Meristemomyces frigidus]
MEEKGAVACSTKAPEHIVTTTTNDAKCHLLLLPAELRNCIYELAITACTFIWMKDARQPALTRTCRQIRGESLPIFYECNTFRIYDEYKSRVRRPDAPFNFGTSASHVGEMKHMQLELCPHGRVYDVKLGANLKDYEMAMMRGGQFFAVVADKKLRGCVVNAFELAHGKTKLDSMIEKGVEELGAQELGSLIKAIVSSHAQYVREYDA